MNAVGMVVCCSHASCQASLDKIATSSQPVIFSHSNACAVYAHPRHICYVAELVGVEHVGVSLDYAFDLQEIEAFFEGNRDMFPISEYGSTLEMVAPETFGLLPDVLAACGMSPRETQLVLGGNWERMARAVWR